MMLALVLPGMVSAQDWYRSNAAGLRLERIGAADRDRHEWVVRVTGDTARTEQQLLQNGEVVESIITETGTGDSSRLEERSAGGVVRSRVRYSPSGSVLEEETFDEDGLLSERYQYRYDGDRRVETRLLVDDELVSTDRYLYSANGMLREVRREYEDQQISRSSRYLFVRGSLTEEQHESGPRTDRIRYDHLGRIVRTQRLADGEPVVTTEYLFEGERFDPIRSVTTDQLEHTTTVDRFDSSGRIAGSETTSSEGRVLVRIEREFGPHGIEFEHRFEPAARSTARFTYDENGELRSEERRLNDRLQTRILYTGEDTRQEERYRAGELVLRLFVQNDRIITQEVIRDGEVVHSR